MVSKLDRLETTRLLAKVFNIEDFLNPDSLTQDELNYYNSLTRALDKHIDKYVDWLGTSEAQEFFYEESRNRKNYFESIDSELDEIIQDTSLNAERIIEKIYRKGLNRGYQDIQKYPVFNDACKYGLKATQEYNFELITSVCDDFRETIKHDIFRGIAEGQSLHEVARSITDAGLKPIEGKTLTAYQRASLIARTEISRSMSTGRLQAYANYGVEKVKILTAGDSNVCPICMEAAVNIDKHIDNVYTLEEAQGLIPFHPACRCSIIAVIEHVQNEEESVNEKLLKHPIKDRIMTLLPKRNKKELTLDELNKLSFDELANKLNVKYHGLETYNYDGKKYHKFVETFDDGREFTLRFEEGAVKSYLKKGIATPNEIINEVFKVPSNLRNETREIWFKNTNAGITHRQTQSGYDSLPPNLGGRNICWDIRKKHRVQQLIPDAEDFNHRIVINPKYFKGASGKYASIWKQNPDEVTEWKFTIHHEFTHSIDTPKTKWTGSDLHPVSYDEEYSKVKRKEPYFTDYAGESREEYYAEHGGYVSYMLANPQEQSKLLHVNYRDPVGGIVEKDITFEDYKKLYPKNYEYFKKKFGV